MMNDDYVMPNSVPASLHHVPYIVHPTAMDVSMIAIVLKWGDKRHTAATPKHATAKLINAPIQHHHQCVATDNLIQANSVMEMSEHAHDNVVTTVLAQPRPNQSVGMEP